MSWKKIKLKQILKQYRIEHLVQNDIEYKQVTISKYDGVTFRGTKMGKEIGRKRQFKIDLKKYPNTLMFVRQGVQDGSIGIAPLEVDGCIATENMPMFSIEGINLEYLKFLLKSPYFYDELNKIQTTGSAQKSIHEREILEIEIPFPDIDEQEEIVKELSSKKDNSIEISTELSHQLTLVKKLRQQLLQDAMQGKLVEQNPKDEPANELLKKIKAEKEKLIAEKKLKKEKELPPIKPEEIPFEIPESWIWCRLGEITTLLTDGKHGDSRDQKDSGYYFLSAKDIQNGKFIYENARQITYEDFIETHRRTNLEPGDLCVVNTGATIGKTAFAPVNELTRKTTFQKSVAILKVLNHHTSMKFIEYFIIFETPKLLKTSRGSAINNLLLGDMKNVLFPMPPLAEQTRIVQKLDEQMQYCNELEASIKQSESQNEKLLQQVLREALRKEPVGV